jgi:hypothetical protein
MISKNFVAFTNIILNVGESDTELDVKSTLYNFQNLLHKFGLNLLDNNIKNCEYYSHEEIKSLLLEVKDNFLSYIYESTVENFSFSSRYF